MSSHTLASSRRRTTVVALAIALVAGAAALFVADGSDVPAATSVPMVTVAPAPLPAAVHATAGMASSSMQAVEPTSAVANATDPIAAPTDLADDPLADVILVAVDPADALLADQEAVAVSD